MAGEDSKPSLDPRDPRGESDIEKEVADEILAAVDESGIDDRERLMRVIAGGLQRQTEQQELRHIAGGASSEEAAKAVGDDLDERIRRLREMIAGPQTPQPPGQVPPEQQPGGSPSADA